MATVLLAAELPGSARYYWSQSGASIEQFDRDNTECARDASANRTEAAHGMVLIVPVFERQPWQSPFKWMDPRHLHKSFLSEPVSSGSATRLKAQSFAGLLSDVSDPVIAG